MSGCNFFFLPCQNCSVLPVEQPCVVSHFPSSRPCASALTDKLLVCRPRHSNDVASGGAKLVMPASFEAEKNTYINTNKIRKTCNLSFSTHLPFRCSTDEVHSEASDNTSSCPSPDGETYLFPPSHFPRRSTATLFSFTLGLPPASR